MSQYVRFDNGSIDLAKVRGFELSGGEPYTTIIVKFHGEDNIESDYYEKESDAEVVFNLLILQLNQYQERQDDLAHGITRKRKATPLPELPSKKAKEEEKKEEEKKEEEEKKDKPTQ